MHLMTLAVSTNNFITHVGKRVCQPRHSVQMIPNTEYLTLPKVCGIILKSSLGCDGKLYEICCFRCLNIICKIFLFAYERLDNVLIHGAVLALSFLVYAEHIHLQTLCYEMAVTKS